MFNLHVPTDVLYKQTQIETSIYGPDMCSQYPSNNQFVNKKQLMTCSYKRKIERLYECTQHQKTEMIPKKTPKKYYSLRHGHEFGVTVNFYIVFIQLHALHIKFIKSPP